MAKQGRVTIWNSFLHEAIGIRERLAALDRGEAPVSGPELLGGRLPDEQQSVLMLLAVSTLAIEARANHLIAELVEKELLTPDEGSAAERLPLPEKWTLLPKLAGVDQELPTGEGCHQAVVEICRRRNDIFHVSFDRLTDKLPLPGKALALFRDFVAAMEDMNVILGRVPEPREAVLGLGSVGARTAKSSPEFHTEGDAKLVADRAASVLDLEDARLTDEYFYASLSLCVLDAVYSIGVKYAGVQNVVRCYCEHYGLPRFRPDRSIIPPREEQEGVSELVKRIDDLGPEAFARDIVRNRQRTSSRGGVLKAEAVADFARCLERFGVEHLQDVDAIVDDDSFAGCVKSVRGQSSGVSLRYFFMLAGSEDLIKPDRMISRFIEGAVGRSVSLDEAQDLLSGATSILRSEYPELTPRLLDYVLWAYQREQ